jgi:hypothetical protein
MALVLRMLVLALFIVGGNSRVVDQPRFPARCAYRLNGAATERAACGREALGFVELRHFVGDGLATSVCL